jgi:hypothetical protein
MITNHVAAQSALYHIESIERKLKLLKQYINPEAGVVNNMQVVCGLVNSVDDEIIGLEADLVRFL